VHYNCGSPTTQCQRFIRFPTNLVSVSFRQLLVLFIQYLWKLCWIIWNNQLKMRCSTASNNNFTCHSSLSLQTSGKMREWERGHARRDILCHIASKWNRCAPSIFSCLSSFLSRQCKMRIIPARAPMVPNRAANVSRILRPGVTTSRLLHLHSKYEIVIRQMLIMIWGFNPKFWEWTSNSGHCGSRNFNHVWIQSIHSSYRKNLRRPAAGVTSVQLFSLLPNYSTVLANLYKYFSLGFERLLHGNLQEHPFALKQFSW